MKIFVNGYDFEVAKKIESNHQGNWVQAIRCQADLSLFPSMLLRIETSGGLVLFGPSEDGFIRLAHSEALRLRLAIYRLLVEPTEEQASISKPASDAAVAVKALALSA